MPDRRMRRRNRVVGSLGPLAPAVEDAQHERIGTRSGRHRANLKSPGRLYTRNLARRGSVPSSSRCVRSGPQTGIRANLRRRPIIFAESQLMKALFLGGVAAATAAGIRSRLPADLEVEI